MHNLKDKKLLKTKIKWIMALWRWQKYRKIQTSIILRRRINNICMPKIGNGQMFGIEKQLGKVFWIYTLIISHLKTLLLILKLNIPFPQLSLMNRIISLPISLPQLKLKQLFKICILLKLLGQMYFLLFFIKNLTYY